MIFLFKCERAEMDEADYYFVTLLFQNAFSRHFRKSSGPSCYFVTGKLE